MEQKYKVEKINTSARVATPHGTKNVEVGYIYTCKDKLDFDHKMQKEGHHWKDVTEYPEVAKPKPVKAPKKGKKGAK